MDCATNGSMMAMCRREKRCIVALTSGVIAALASCGIATAASASSTADDTHDVATRHRVTVRVVARCAASGPIADLPVAIRQIEPARIDRADEGQTLEDGSLVFDLTAGRLPATFEVTAGLPPEFASACTERTARMPLLRRAWPHLSWENTQFSRRLVVVDAADVTVPIELVATPVVASIARLAHGVDVPLAATPVLSARRSSVVWHDHRTHGVSIPRGQANELFVVLGGSVRSHPVSAEEATSGIDLGRVGPPSTSGVTVGLGVRLADSGVEWFVRARTEWTDLQPGLTLVSADGTAIYSIPEGDSQGGPIQVVIPPGRYFPAPGRFTAHPMQLTLIDALRLGAVPSIDGLPMLEVAASPESELLLLRPRHAEIARAISRLERRIQSSERLTERNDGDVAPLRPVRVRVRARSDDGPLSLVPFRLVAIDGLGGSAAAIAGGVTDGDGVLDLYVAVPPSMRRLRLGLGLSESERDRFGVGGGREAQRRARALLREWYIPFGHMQRRAIELRLDVDGEGDQIDVDFHATASIGVIGTVDSGDPLSADAAGVAAIVVARRASLQAPVVARPEFVLGPLPRGQPNEIFFVPSSGAVFSMALTALDTRQPLELGLVTIPSPEIGPQVRILWQEAAPEVDVPPGGRHRIVGATLVRAGDGAIRSIRMVRSGAPASRDEDALTMLPVGTWHVAPGLFEATPDQLALLDAVRLGVDVGSLGVQTIDVTDHTAEVTIDARASVSPVRRLHAIVRPYRRYEQPRRHRVLADRPLIGAPR